MKKWRMIVTDPADGYYNMALDEAIMKSHRQKLCLPTLRFYRWEPPALSLGYFQNHEEEVDVNNCQEKNVDVVRRPTGGRAILHENELTYSIAVNESLDLLSKSVVESYRQISSGLVQGLNMLDVPAELKPREGKKAPRGQSSACFDTPSWYEVVVNDKKLIGSAQTRKDGTILQHGSLPLSRNTKKIFSLFDFSSERERRKMRRIYSSRSTALYECLTEEKLEEISFEQLTEALKEGLETALSVKIERGKLSEKEKAMAEELKSKKYLSEEWLKKR